MNNAIVVNLSLDAQTVELLRKQASQLHVSKSALVRLLLVQNEKTKTMGVEHG